MDKYHLNNSCQSKLKIMIKIWVKMDQLSEGKVILEEFLKIKRQNKNQKT